MKSICYSCITIEVHIIRKDEGKNVDEVKKKYNE